MLKLTVVEFFFRLIPEAFLFIFAGYAFSKTKVNLKRYLLSGAVLSIIGYLVRMLPINFGIHSVLILVACIVLLVTINKIPMMKAVSASLIIMIVGFAAEALNGIFIQNVLGKDMELIFQDPSQKVLYGLPSLGLMGLIIAIVYIIHYKRDKLTDVLNREDIK
jgi:hypothetical protein